ncbi:MAG: molybdopterin molybdotransferase MoeA, partial [Hyphomicrobiales bacterium]
MSTTRQLLDDCFLHDKDRLRHHEALALLEERLSPIAAREEIVLNDAVGRVLAKPVLAPRPVPAHTNSAVDGYALLASSVNPNTENTLPVTARIAAGHGAQQALAPGHAARIFTGAPMPEGADTVVMQEDCETQGQSVTIPAGVKANMNVRKAGEDVEKDDVVAGAGRAVTPQLLAAIASTGVPKITCYAPLKVALVSSGDEVIRPGEPF